MRRSNGGSRFLVWAAAAALSVCVQATGAGAGGPIILSGHDPDDHGFTSQYVPLYNAIFANVTNGGSGILSIGANTGSSAGNWIATVAGLMTPPQTVTYVNNAAISTVSFAGYAIIHVPSTSVDTPGGISPSTENPLLSARAADIATFINAGGGLFGLTQDQVADAYDYLGVFADVQATGVPSSGDCDGAGGSALYDNVTVTPLGTTLGITDSNIDGCCWHNTFNNFAPFLNTLATANEPLCTSPSINGQASVIGCLQCNIPGQMNLDPPVDLNPLGSNHTVTATFLQGQAPNNPIVGAIITFTVISGPNIGATGIDVTDINGEATFTYTGSGGVGLDVIQAVGVDPFTSQTIISNNALKFWDYDCNNNAIPDTCDLDCGAYGGACLANYALCGGSTDLNSNDIPDSCDECVTDDDCDDDVYCNGAETCDVDSCELGTPVNCNDGFACTADSCNEATDQCDYVPSNGACSNGLFCDGAEVCTVGVGCEAGPPVICNDGISCTLDTCNEGTDQCNHITNDGACNDFLYCNGVESCDLVNGCEAGTPVDCNDAVACTVDSCDEMVDQCANVPNHGACSNGAFCDGNEVCDPGSGCEAGTPVDCGDGVPCTTDACNEATDQCDHTENDAVCNNGLFCDGAETCDLANDCEPGTAPNCNDGVSCTGDSCNETLDQCDHAPNDGFCNDNLFCNGLETCDLVNDCEPGTAPNCNDGVSCTGDSCNESLDQCDHVPSDAVCDNGQFCDGDETCDPVNDCEPGMDPCDPMACSEPLDQCVQCINNGQCNDGLFCNGVESCNVGTGMCIPGAPVVCNDGIVCTDDACNEASDACVAPPNATLCTNGLFCDGLEICNPLTGCQLGIPVVCNDAIPCTVDSCSEPLDQCIITPNHAVCTDGLFCNGAEVCNPVVGCNPGTPVNCGDGVSCTTDACNEGLDQCTFTPNNGVCSDGQFCNGIEICDPLNNCEAGPPVACADGVTCTADTCNEVVDMCESTPDHPACSDGLYCDGSEICDPILGCQSGVIVDCGDDNACTMDTCEESSDMCAYEDICCGNGSIDIGEECDDGNLVDADGCDSNCTYTGCGNGVVTPGEECEYTELCGNLIDDDEDGFFDCADPECQVVNCDANCELAPPCQCIEEDPAIVLLSKTPNFWRIHGRILGDPSTIDPQAEGVLLQLSNDGAIIYTAELPPNSFVSSSPKRYRYRDKTAVSGVDPVGPAAGLYQLSMGFREIDGLSWLTFKIKAYGDFTEATESCMTSQITIGDDLGALRADWTLRKAGAWWLRPGDYVCPGGCAGDAP